MREIGRWLKEQVQEIKDFNVIKGFLNLSLNGAFWLSRFNEDANFFVRTKKAEEKVPSYGRVLLTQHQQTPPRPCAQQPVGSSSVPNPEANGNRLSRPTLSTIGIHICNPCLPGKVGRRPVTLSRPHPPPFGKDMWRSTNTSNRKCRTYGNLKTSPRKKPSIICPDGRRGHAAPLGSSQS